VLGSILTVIATTPDFTWGAILLITYAIGAAAPMLAIAYGGRAVTARLGGLAPISHRVRQGFGVLVIVFAAATYLDYDTTIIAWLSRFYPNGNIGL
jgi:cytochrome c biogenesis protein CcdA